MPRQEASGNDARGATRAPGSSSTSRAVHERLQTQLEPVVTRAGYEIDSLVLSSVGRRTLVRLTVDSDDGVDLDAVAEVTRAVSSSLDESDPFDTPFVLEVSSPGVDRPLTDERHWRRATGRLVTTVIAGTELTGRVLGAADGRLRLEVDGTEREVPLADAGPGRVQVEFHRPAAGTDGAAGHGPDGSGSDDESDDGSDEEGDR